MTIFCLLWWRCSCLLPETSRSVPLPLPTSRCNCFLTMRLRHTKLQTGSRSCNEETSLHAGFDRMGSTSSVALDPARGVSKMHCQLLIVRWFYHERSESDRSSWHETVNNGSLTKGRGMRSKPWVVCESQWWVFGVVVQKRKERKQTLGRWKRAWATA